MAQEETKVVYHETNEGRDSDHGIAGFEGTNALWFICALGLAILIFRQSIDVLETSTSGGLALASIPVILVSLYVFGLKQGKPPSYDIELFEWLVIKLCKKPYFGPKQVEPIHLEWVNVHREGMKPWQES